MTEEEKPNQIQNTSHRTSLYADDLLLDMNEGPSKLPAALDITQKSSAIFGYEINSNKPSLLPLNESMLEVQLTSDIPIVEHFCYSGMEICPDLETTITKNTKTL